MAAPPASAKPNSSLTETTANVQRVKGTFSRLVAQRSEDALNAMTHLLSLLLVSLQVAPDVHLMRYLIVISRVAVVRLHSYNLQMDHVYVLLEINTYPLREAIKSEDVNHVNTMNTSQLMVYVNHVLDAAPIR